MKNCFNSKKAAEVAIMFLLVVSVVLAALPVAEAAGSITLSPSTVSPGDSVTVFGYGFGALKRVGIGLGAEVNVVNEELEVTGPYDVGTGPYIGYVSHVPFKPGSYTKAINVSSTLFLVVDTDNGDGTFTAPTADFLNGTLDYATGKITLHLKAPILTTPHYVNVANYTTYEYDVTPPTRLTASKIGIFQTTITIPEVYNGDYTVTAIDTQGRVATATLTVTGGEEPPVTMWSKTYGGTGQDWGYSVVQTNDGGYAIAGYTRSFGAGQSDAWLVKTDESGTVEWTRTYGGLNEDYGYSVVQTSDGGYAIAGATDPYGTGQYYDFWLIKTDESGTIQWNQTYAGSGGDYGYSVVQTSDGGYAIAGRSYSRERGNDVWLVKSDSSGNAEWNQTYGTEYPDVGYCVVETGDGGYAIAGYTWSYGAGENDFWLVKTDVAGNMLWSKTYGGTGQDYGYSVVQTSDGGYAIAGTTYSFGAGQSDFWLVKTDESGTIQWTHTYGGTGRELGRAMLQSSDGGYVIAGFAEPNESIVSDFYLVKTDSVGNLQWEMTCGGTGDDSALSVTQTFDSGYAMTGVTDSFGSGLGDIWLVKTDEFGVVPEGLSLSIMLLLSTVAVIVSIRYYRKRPKWQNW